MSRRLDDLDPRFRPLAVELLAQAVEAGIAVMIIDTLRTPAEHAANLARGVSWTSHSKHLDGLAIDICPFSVYDLHGPDKLAWAAGPVWDRLGLMGETLGLRWGGRFRNHPDLGHFEYVDRQTDAPHSTRIA